MRKYLYAGLVTIAALCWVPALEARPGHGGHGGGRGGHGHGGHGGHGHGGHGGHGHGHGQSGQLTSQNRNVILYAGRGTSCFHGGRRYGRCCHPPGWRGWTTCSWCAAENCWMYWSPVDECWYYDLPDGYSVPYEEDD
jgi:hypothetical protein